MTIYLSYINIPHGNERCDVSLGPSLPDHEFFFNLGAHKTGETTWRLASTDPVSGNEVHLLSLSVAKGENLILIARSPEGREERLSYKLDDPWLYDGDVVSTNFIADYHRLFEDQPRS